ncbi:FAD/NAD(P)-binding domain-containing protein [Lentinus tigrinus ALCF2SS1-7]|uniref:FAD/NAD(P)-binding domain-containing protein n=1 Tax=Lentinus tigrinus ALCF2SS1-6 TaxID=1328759 RepID=A0A5C2SG02_9APHY|nr:FAD/NAD(P)-binding domain-containing protein [Lentinus tigrinus ALCF2SS1-6]RPD74598.1 FAD/NAD(P)-binding domain-containing protein [Lentinus tigrinus ALCF2SS1-7]
MPESKLNVAIVGGGMVGLAFAIALRKLGPDVTFSIYEGATELSEVGAGITVQRRAWQTLSAIGLEEELLNLAGCREQKSVGYVYRKSDQPEGIHLKTIQTSEPGYTFHRGELQKAMIRHLASTHTIHTRKRLVSYMPLEEGVELHFHDGSTARCDILVGADGVRSAVRSAMYTKLADAALAAGDEDSAKVLKSHILPVFSGNVIYRTLIRKDILPEEAAQHPAFNRDEVMIYAGRNRHLVAYPISQGRVLNLAMVFTAPGKEGSVYEGAWTSSVSKEELVGRYSGWEPDVEEIMKHVSDKILKWVVNVATMLPTYSDGLVTLMGDAAHAMTPHQGAGAGVGFEDAHILAHFLAHPGVTKDTAAVALQVYDAVRRPASQNVATLSRMSGRNLHFNLSAGCADLTEEQSASGEAISPDQLKEVGDAIGKLTEWMFATTVAEDREVAMQKLEVALANAAR